VAAFTAGLIAAWLLVDPRTPDLAAQVYRVDLFRAVGFAVWDEHWYAGHHLPGYSLLFSPLAVLLGLRLLAALSVLASTLLFERLVRSSFGSAAGWSAVPFALAAVGDVWAGRLTFALGVAFAMAAALAFAHRQSVVAAVLAATCAAASPVAGALLGLAALTLALHRRSPRALLVLALPAAVLVLALAALFPEGGVEPYPIRSFAATAVVVGVFWLALPRGASLLRLGGVVYLLACLACLAIHSPVGSNVERYGVLLAAPLLLAAHLADGRPRARVRGRGAAIRVRSALGPAAALALAVTWVVWGPARETAAVAGSPATSAAYYVPVERFLAAQPGSPFRVEVPLTRSHWEAAELAPHVSLARGWEKQLDTRFDGPLLSATLDAGSYERWLHSEAIAYVALPDARLDPSSAREGRLVAGGLPFLIPVFTSAHWRIYRVAGASPLASGPGRITRLGHESFALEADAAGRFLVRVHFTRYWTFTQGAGCVARAPGDWTDVRVTRPGAVVLAARFSLSRAFATGGSCSGRVAQRGARP
jgi:hypothetical protein